MDLSRELIDTQGNISAGLPIPHRDTSAGLSPRHLHRSAPDPSSRHLLVPRPSATMNSTGVSLHAPVSGLAADQCRACKGFGHFARDCPSVRRCTQPRGRGPQSYINRSDTVEASGNAVSLPRRRTVSDLLKKLQAHNDGLFKSGTSQLRQGMGTMQAFNMTYIAKLRPWMQPCHPDEVDTKAVNAFNCKRAKSLHLLLQTDLITEGARKKTEKNIKKSCPRCPGEGTKKRAKMSERMDIIGILRSSADCSVSAGRPLRGQPREDCDKVDVPAWHMGLVIPEVYIKIKRL
ncbi:hypothetical protein Bbelb_187130 [Branchiostoma belcheri]|nr:hypothetical protein Bbelb_187130 [Branchiostoma belcheri]